MKDFYTEKSVPGKMPIGLLYYATSITSRCILIALTLYYVKERYQIWLMASVHLIVMALPCAVIGSYSKSIFEEAERKLAGKRRKMLWRLFFYFILAIPSIYMVWLSTIFTWVDVYGIPARKPCQIRTHTEKRERRRVAGYGSALIYYWCILFGENIILTGYFYLLRQQLVVENAAGNGRI